MVVTLIESKVTISCVMSDFFLGGGGVAEPMSKYQLYYNVRASENGDY